MATYWVKSGTGGTDAGTSWANAAESIPGLMTAQAIAGGDIIYVHNTHAYTSGAAITWTLPETGTGTVQVLCVDGGDATGASLVDGTVGTLRSGASESTNGNFAFTVNSGPGGASDDNGLYVHGLTIKAGAGGNSSAADITVGTTSAHFHFQDCLFWCDSTSTSATMIFGGGVRALAILTNCEFKFGATTPLAMTVGLGTWEFVDCKLSGTAVTTAFAWGSNRTTYIHCSGCDWSNCTNVLTVASSTAGLATFSNCTVSNPITGTHIGTNGPRVEFMACNAVDAGAGADVLQYLMEDGYGVVEDDQTVYVTSGPAQGTQDDGTATSYSLKMTPGTRAAAYQPLYTPWIWTKVASTGSKTISMKAADTEAAVLKNSELWLEVEYMGGAAPANSPQTALEGTFPLVGTYHDVSAAGSNLTDTGDAWTGIVETGTYTLSKTVTLDEQGYIRCRVGLGKDTTNPVYVDPKITVA